jgi:hypothetical protein
MLLLQTLKVNLCKIKINRDIVSKMTPCKYVQLISVIGVAVLGWVNVDREKL